MKAQTIAQAAVLCIALLAGCARTAETGSAPAPTPTPVDLAKCSRLLFAALDAAHATLDDVNDAISDELPEVAAGKTASGILAMKAGKGHAEVADRLENEAIARGCPR